ncbi:MAG: cytochrome C [Deltaproteobacteria bacterium]|nr:cytochrome C [Deltaproteobacteria bacterium]
MMRRTALAWIVAVTVFVPLAGCSVVSQTPSVPPKHPEELRNWSRVDCRECHSGVSTGALKPYHSFRHTRAFVDIHGLYARQGQNLCASCHAPSFCQTCHARTEEIKPSTKMGDRPDLALPHRGDYIVTHRLDGRIDPGSCFRCHGNKEDTRCRACHK